jgi:hypothetical protein
VAADGYLLAGRHRSSLFGTVKAFHYAAVLDTFF